MSIRALCVIKDEVDVIEQCLGAAEVWCDEIYVLDNGSGDGSWESVISLAASHPRIVPFGRDLSPFRDSIRAQIFRAIASTAVAGDWWCRLDADEFYADDPRTFLASTPDNYFSVWSKSLSYYFTDVDAAHFFDRPEDFADHVPVAEKCRFYLNHWSEPRFFRHDRRLRWHERDGGFPAALWSRPASPHRILLQHYPYRSPAQIQNRLDARRSSAEFSHEAVSNWAGAVAGIRATGCFVGIPTAGVSESWRDRIVPATALDYDAHDGNFVLNERLMPQIPNPIGPIARWERTARTALRRPRATTADAG